MTLAADTMRTDLDSNPRAMARGAAVNLLGAFAANGLGLVVTLVVTHMVSASAIGLVAIGTTIVSLVGVVALFGLDTGVIRFVALGAGGGDERAARAVVQLSITFVMLTSGALTAVLWWKAPWLADRFFQKPAATEIIRLVSLSLPPLVLSRVVMAAVQGYGIMEYSAWLGIIRRLVDLASVVPLLALGLGAKGLAISGIVSATTCAGFALFFLTRVHPRVFVPAFRSWPVFRLLNFSGPQVLSATLYTTMLWTSTLLLARFGTAREVGIYAVLGTLLLPARVVSTAVGQMFAPRIAAEDARGDRITLATILKRVTHWNTAVSLPLFAVLAVVPGPLLEIFGPVYSDGAAALAILAVGQFVNTAAGPLGPMINMSGRQYLSAANHVGVAALNLGVGLVLIPRYGMVGAALATVCALTLVNLLTLVEVRVLFGCHPFREDSIRTFLAAALAVAVAVPAAIYLNGLSAVAEVVLVGGLLLVVYVAAIWMFGLSDEDRELLALARTRLTGQLGLSAR
jgi:O-antigen/teichoic acid export membrane protein